MGIAWNSVQIGAGVSDTSVRINSIVVAARNFGPEEIELKDAYVLSGVDGSKAEMDVSNEEGTDSFRLKDIAPVPALASLNFRLVFPGGISEADFLKKWQQFSIVIVYDDKNSTSVRQTLHEIGREFGLTRERIRQIAEDWLMGRR